MTDTPVKHSSAWTTFTTASFILAAGMMAGGIYFLEASFSAKGFYAMAAIMLVNTSISLTKTLRITRKPENWSTKLKTQKLKNY